VTTDIKFEHGKAKAESRTTLGALVELSAPELVASINAPQRPNKSVIFVIDNSGSMQGHRLDIVKRAIIEQLPKFRAGDSLGIVTFSSEARVVLPLTRFNESAVAEYRYQVEGIHADSNTNLEAGLRLGIEEADRRGSESGDALVILLSDGQANSGNTNPGDLGLFVAHAYERGITTATIGIGEGYDERILVALSENGRGNHAAALQNAQAATAIRAEIEDLNARTMLDTRIEVELLNPFTGYDARVRCFTKVNELNRRDCRAIAVVGDLTAGQEKNIAFEFKLSAAPNLVGQHVQAIRIRVSYTDGNTMNRVEFERIHEVEVVPAARWREPRRNPDVVAELRDLRLQKDKERIYELLQAGREREARALLDRLNLDLAELSRMGLTSRNLARFTSQIDELTMNSMLDADLLAKSMLASKLEREYDRKKRF
jgi:Ca-activated chloride channel family protein